MSEYLDTSVVVKWFKEGEAYRDEALVLRDRLVDFDGEFVMSYYGVIELVRALVKTGFSREKIEDAFQSLVDLYEIGALKTVKIEEVLYLVKDIEVELNLYAADALHLASAIHHDCDVLWSVDEHFLKNKTKRFLKTRRVEVKHLSEIKL